MSGEVPAATHAQIAAFGHDVNEARVGVFVHSLGGSIGGMALGTVLNHEHVVFKARLLLQCTVDGIAYRANPVAHGNHHGHLYRELALGDIDVPEARFEVASHFLEILGCSLFHLYL